VSPISREAHLSPYPIDIIQLFRFVGTKFKYKTGGAMAITGVKYRDGKGSYRKIVPMHLKQYLGGRAEFKKTVKAATKTDAERALLPFIAGVAEQLVTAER
jgi:hypothetical protein